MFPSFKVIIDQIQTHIPLDIFIWICMYMHTRFPGYEPCYISLYSMCSCKDLIKGIITYHRW